MFTALNGEQDVLLVKGGTNVEFTIFDSWGNPRASIDYDNRRNAK